MLAVHEIPHQGCHCLFSFHEQRVSTLHRTRMQTGDQDRAGVPWISRFRAGAIVSHREDGQLDVRQAPMSVVG